MEITYKNKYNKYSNLLKKYVSQIGGSSFCLVSESFRQHSGECWNDSIQMILASCDGIKESVQDKLLHMTSDAIIDQFIFDRTKISRLNEIFLENNGIELKGSNIPRLKEYLDNFSSRLCDYHLNNFKHLPDDSICVPKRFMSAHKTPVLFEQERDVSIQCAKSGLELLEIFDISKGATFHSLLALFNLLTLLLCDNTKSIFLHASADIKNIHWLNTYKHAIVGYFVSCISVDTQFGHVFACIKCNNESYIYDDNYVGMMKYDRTNLENWYFNNHNIIFGFIDPAYDLSQEYNILEKKYDDADDDDVRAKFLLFRELQDIKMKMRELRSNSRPIPYILLDDNYYELSSDTKIDDKKISKDRMIVVYKNIILSPITVSELNDVQKYEIHNYTFQKILNIEDTPTLKKHTELSNLIHKLDSLDVQNLMRYNSDKFYNFIFDETIVKNDRMDILRTVMSKIIV